MRKLFAVIVFLLASLTPAFAQGFIGQGGPSWVFADQYGSWSLKGQTANTYTFSPAQAVNFCQVARTDNSDSPQFAAFSSSVGLAPVLIYDVNSANSEVVTPGSAYTNTSNTCGVNITASNQHKTFWLQSGTGGLQEALNAVGASTATYPTVIYLTPNWYKNVSAISSLNATLATSTTPNSIIAAAKCTSQAYVLDITTVPETTYVCTVAGGAGYAGTAGNLIQVGIGGSIPNARVTSYTNIAVPTALTTVAATCATNGGGCITTSTTGGSIPASGAYTLGATCIDSSGGETTLSVDTAGGATVTVGATATNTISVTSPAGCTAANGAAGWRLYMTAASGASLSEILYSPTPSFYLSYPSQNIFVASTVMPIGATATISAIITGTATIPTVNTAYPRTLGASTSYPPFPALGTVAAAATGTLGTINFQAGLLNALGRQITICGNGYATTNSTAGTLTLATTLASIPGVTSITPFTAVSGSTAASAQADPFDFCITYTTAKTGTTGNLEAHGWVLYSLSGTAVGTPAVDIITAVSSNIDLTKQDQLAFTIKPTTTALTAAQLRQVSIVSTN